MGRLKINIRERITIMKLQRYIDKDSIDSLTNDVSLMGWENMMNETDVDKSYMFLDVFTKKGMTKTAR